MNYTNEDLAFIMITMGTNPWPSERVMEIYRNGGSFVEFAQNRGGHRAYLRNIEHVKNYLIRTRNFGYTIIPITSDRYPKKLKEIKNPLPIIISW